jgi:hypothetical protein
MRSRFFVALLSDPLVEMAILFSKLLTIHPLTVAAHLLVLPLFQSAPTEIQLLLAPSALGSARLIGRAVSDVGRKATTRPDALLFWPVLCFVGFAFKTATRLGPLVQLCGTLSANFVVTKAMERLIVRSKHAANVG